MNEPQINATTWGEQAPPQTHEPVDHNGVATGHSSEESVAELLDYNPVPSKRSVTLLVRYRIRGRGQPTPYPLAEEDDE